MPLAKLKSIDHRSLVSFFKSRNILYLKFDSSFSLVILVNDLPAI